MRGDGENPGATEGVGVDGPTASQPADALTVVERRIVALVGLAIVAMGGSRIPPGILAGDAGDFQVACATMGIAHSPGYVGYTFLFWFPTKLFFFVDPAYVVQFCCLLCMALAHALCAALLIRLGVHALAAAAVALGFTLYRWTWFNMVVAEVYAPSLAALTGCVFLLHTYGRTGRRWMLCAAAALYGLLVANRPPAALYLPGFLVALWWIERRGRVGQVLRRMVGAGATAAAAAAAVLALLLYLESPTTAYNYLYDYAEARPGIPEDDGTARAAVARAAWLITAQDFNWLKGSDIGQARSKLRWIRRQLFVYDTRPLLCALLGLGLGGYVLVRRSPDLAAMLACIVIGAIAFQTQYRVHDDATDLVPVAWSLLTIGGAYLARWLPRRIEPPRVTLLAAFCIATLGSVAVYNATRYNPGQTRAAAAFVEELDLASFPRRSVVASEWSLSRPVLYAKLVRSPRPDIHVVRVNETGNWKDDVVEYLDRPLFYTQEQATPDGFTLRPFRNVFELVPVEGSEGVRE